MTRSVGRGKKTQAFVTATAERFFSRPNSGRFTNGLMRKVEIRQAADKKGKLVEIDRTLGEFHLCTSSTTTE